MADSSTSQVIDTSSIIDTSQEPVATPSFWTDHQDVITTVVLALAVCLVFWVVSSILYRKVFPAITKRLDADKHPMIDLLVNGFRRPLALLLKITGICVAVLMIASWLTYQPLDDQTLSFFVSLEQVTTKILRIAIILGVTWGLVASSDISKLFLRGARHKLDIDMSRSVSRFLSAVFKVVVVIIALAALLNEFGFNISALVAGLGLGGLTVALAAQDSAANFFGGLVLITEKPFDIGDWITCSDVEGTVEDISLRSTKVRTNSGALAVVPNSLLSGAPISNWTSGMKRRRADFTLTLVYDTPKDAIKKYADAVYTLLETDPEVSDDGLIVRFSSLSASSLDIRVIFYTIKPAMADHLRILERINYALLGLAEQQGVGFAYPTQSLFIERPEDSQLPDSPQPPIEKQDTAKDDTSKDNAPKTGPQ
ncbi:MAG: mechanosensitive ion channel [Ruminococcaceae bacterium]|nr:mechanosensitive ion channel [Oscillospiraceae bacterium]